VSAHAALKLGTNQGVGESFGRMWIDLLHTMFDIKRVHPQNKMFPQLVMICCILFAVCDFIE
jgi:hypothetical protein